MEEYKTIGINTIKKVSTDIILTFKEFQNDYKDQKISKTEWLAKIDNAITLIKDFFQYKILVSEFIDIDAEEGIELVNHIAATLEISDTKAKKLAIYVIQLIDAEIKAYNEIIAPAIELLKSENN